MNKTTVTLVLGALGLLAACSSSAPYPAYMIEDDAEQQHSVVVTDEELLDAIRVGEPFVERVVGSNVLHVRIPIRNVLPEDYVQFLAQIEFRDSMQRPLGDVTNSQPMTIAPGMTQDFESTATKPEASEYVLRLSPNR